MWNARQVWFERLFHWKYELFHGWAPYADINIQNFDAKSLLLRLISLSGIWLLASFLVWNQLNSFASRIVYRRTIGFRFLEFYRKHLNAFIIRIKWFESFAWSASNLNSETAGTVLPGNDSSQMAIAHYATNHIQFQSVLIKNSFIKWFEA